MAGSLVAPIVGAAAGSVFGGKGQKSTAQTKPYMPESREKAFELQLEDALKAYQTPFRPVERRRAELSPSDQFGGIFFNPEMADIQNQSDTRFMQTLFSPQADAGQQAAAQAEQQAAMQSMQSKMDAQDWMSRQRSQFLPGTKQSQLLGRVSNNDVLGQLLADYQKQYGEPADRLDALSMFDPQRAQTLYS